jgi:hypothetical protein
MNRFLFSTILLTILSSMQVPAQTSLPTMYAESFRHGTTQITEQSFEAKLDSQNGGYRDRIKDSRGADRFALTIVPQGPEGDTKITSWQVKLADLRHPIYDNVLAANQESSSDAGNRLWWLDPSRFSPVPIRARRVIKVESFYVVLQVTAHHFTPGDSPYLDSMSVEMQFTNTDPRREKP